MTRDEKAIPTSIVIFGASGDLTGRKLIPSLFNLYCKGRLPDRVSIYGFSITEWSSEEFRNDISQHANTLAGVDVTRPDWQHFVSLLNYQIGDFTNQDAYQQLSSALNKLEGWQSAYAPPLAFYKPGTWGPSEADEFMDRDGCAWLPVCKEQK
jgi:glucose-6-phosphate 1-dehydrogenase